MGADTLLTELAGRGQRYHRLSLLSFRQAIMVNSVLVSHHKFIYVPYPRSVASTWSESFDGIFAAFWRRTRVRDIEGIREY